jgi:membrane protein DedA with SNARE-associated domain/membrane-associated phospholipid phosphatase
MIDAKPFLDWLHLHAQWGGVIAFTIAFFECLALIGLVLPGVIFMTALGTLIGAGILPFTTITLCAIAGAILGDVISFSLGYHYHQHIRDLWPFRNYPNLFQKGEKFFLEHGGKGIFLGRFLGPIRPILPLVAGMMSLSPTRFLVADIPSAILWAPVYLLPGMLVGFASQELAPGMEAKLLLFMLGVLLILWCVWWLLKRIFLTAIGTIRYMFSNLWRVVQTNNFCKQALFDPLRPNSSSQLILAVTGLLAFIAFVILLVSVAHHGILLAWNDPVYYFMRSLRVTAVDPWMVAITTIDPAVLTLMWLAVLGCLLWCRNRWAAAHWLAIGLLAFAARFIIKHLVQYPRPPGLLQSPEGWSFPSGHTLLSVTFFGFLAVLIARYWQRDNRWLAYVSAALLAFVILFSRLYLGAHWFTDVTGSVLLGFFFIAITTISYRRRQVPKIAAGKTLLIAVLALGFGWSWQMAHHFKIDLRGYTPVWTIQTLNSKQWWQQKNTTQPMYRVDRFGKPIEILNVQWAGSLPVIEQTLAQQNWRLVPKGSLLGLLNGLAKKKPNQQLPVLSRFYEDRKPVLIMFKFIPLNEVLILRLWDAHMRLSNGTPLWIGVVDYHKSWRVHFLQHSKNTAPSDTPIQALPAPTDLFRNDLTSWSWKQIIYPNQQHHVLLIRSQ